MRFKDRVAIITGAGSGMGLAAAKLMSSEGATVALNDINPDVVGTLAASINADGGRAIAIPGDIGDKTYVEDATGRVVKEFGKVDILLNVAGYAAHGPAEEYDVWDRMVNVNMNGTYYFCRAVGRHSMIPNRRGAIVNISSLSGLVAHPFDIGYIAAKHGVIGITKALAIEWARFNIRVNCICPGYTQTGIFAAVEQVDPERFKPRARKVPMGRAADPREQATVMAFLASDDASYVTGLIMPVDGGQMALSSGWLPPEVDHPTNA